MEIETLNPTLRSLDSSPNREGFWKRTKGLGQHDTVKLKLSKSNTTGALVDTWAVKLSAQTGFVIDAWTKITGWTERLDTHTAFTSDEFTAPLTGNLRISANIWGGTPGPGSTNSQLLIGFFKNGALVTDTVRGSSIFAGYYDTQDSWWIGPTSAGDVWDIRAMFCPAAAGVTTTNATVGAYTEIDAGTTQIVSFCRFEMY